MKTNEATYEYTELEKVSQKLHQLKEEKLQCQLEFDNEEFLCKNAPASIDRSKHALKLTLVIAIFLTLISIPSIAYIYADFKQRQEGNGAEEWALVGILINVILTTTIIVFCIACWVRVVFLIKKMSETNLNVINSVTRIKVIKEKLLKLEEEIDALEIQRLKLIEEQKREIHERQIKEERERNESQTRKNQDEEQQNREKYSLKNTSKSERGFTLREYEVSETQKAEESNECDKNIKRLNKIIYDEKIKIKDYEKIIETNEQKYKAVRKVSLIMLAIFILIEDITILVSNSTLKSALGMCNAAVVICYVIMYIREYQAIFFNYFFEENPNFFKNYAMSHDLYTNGQQIAECGKRIRQAQLDIEINEDKKKYI